MGCVKQACHVVPSRDRQSRRTKRTWNEDRPRAIALGIIFKPGAPNRGAIISNHG